MNKRIIKKPNRYMLLRVLTELQNMVGEASATHADDRNPQGFEKAQKLLEEAFDLCVEARSFDPPGIGIPTAGDGPSAGTAEGG